MQNSNENEQELDQQIKQLTRRLKRLATEKKSVERQVRDLQKRQKDIHLQRLKDNRDRFLRRQRETQRRLSEAAKDRHGNILVLGDRVRFLTKGLYAATEGIITKVGKSRITARDNYGALINRAPKNVEIIEDSDRSSSSEADNNNFSDSDQSSDSSVEIIAQVTNRRRGTKTSQV